MKKIVKKEIEVLTYYCDDCIPKSLIIQNHGLCCECKKDLCEAHKYHLRDVGETYCRNCVAKRTLQDCNDNLSYLGYKAILVKRNFETIQCFGVMHNFEAIFEKEE